MKINITLMELPTHKTVPYCNAIEHATDRHRIRTRWGCALYWGERSEYVVNPYMHAINTLIGSRFEVFIKKFPQ